MPPEKSRQPTDPSSALPAPREALLELLSAVETALEDSDCRHTLRLTKRAVADLELEPELVLPWLKEHGGVCDCEVVLNVRDSCAELE